MRFFTSARVVCQYLAVLIVSCSLLLRVLSVGYVIGGLFIKFRDPLLSTDLLQFLNSQFLGILRLGSMINALILFPIPAVVINICNASFTYFGICKRKPHCLKISSAISILMIIFYTIMVAIWSWFLGELYYGVKGSFVSVHLQDPALWNSKWINMKCCNVEKQTYMYSGCFFVDGCFDLFANTINTYGSLYIAAFAVNILAETAMVIGLEYLHRLQLVLIKSKPGKRMETKELHNIRNGIVVPTLVALKSKFSKNGLASTFGCLSMFSLALDGSVVLAILLLKYNLHDITLTEEFYEITGAHNINLGYTEGALLITTMCVFIWSMIAKIMYIVGIFFYKKWLFASNVFSEIITLLVECIMVVFAVIIVKATICCFWKNNAQCSEYSYPSTTVNPFSVCDYWTNSGTIFLWAFTLVLFLHIILKIILIIMSDRVYKRSISGKSVQNRESVGIFKEMFLVAKRFPSSVTTALLISIVICIIDCLYFCGLLIVRYGSSSNPFIEVADVLRAIKLGPRSMTDNRDNAIFICLASLSVSFFLQLGKLAAFFTKSPKTTLLISWLELPVIILQLVSVSFVATAIKLVYCCLYDDQCVFSYENSLTVSSPISYSYPNSVKSLFCDNEQKVWERVMLQSWLMFGFGGFCIFLQILSIIFGYKYFKQSAFGDLGIFRGVLEIFGSLLNKISDNRYINEKKMPNYNKIYGMYCILSTVCLVLEFSFALLLYAYYFTEGNSSSLLSLLDLISYYRYFLNPLYQGIAISSLVIVPLVAILRISSFVWFWFRKSEVPLYTILVFIPVWTLGEIVLLCHTSYIIRLANSCMDSDSFTFHGPSQSTVCAGLGKSLYIQSGVIVAYLVMHIILNVAILVTLGMMQPYIVKNKEKQFSVFQAAIKNLKQHSNIQRIFLATLIITLVLNFIVWIGVILMGLIPGYIHTGFLDYLSSNMLAVAPMDAKSTVLGIVYSLLVVIPLNGAVQVIGVFGLFKRYGKHLWVLIICTAIFCIADLVYLVFTSDIIHFRRCFCDDEFTCQSYNTTSTEEAFLEVCGNLFLDSSSVLITYILITLITHILALILGIKIIKGLRVRKVGIDNRNKNPLQERDQHASAKNIDEALGGKSIENDLNLQKPEDNEEMVSRHELQSIAKDTKIMESKTRTEFIEKTTPKSQNTVVRFESEISRQNVDAQEEWVSGVKLEKVHNQDGKVSEYEHSVPKTEGDGRYNEGISEHEQNQQEQKPTLPNIETLNTQRGVDNEQNTVQNIESKNQEEVLPMEIEQDKSVTGIGGALK